MGRFFVGPNDIIFCTKYHNMSAFPILESALALDLDELLRRGVAQARQNNRPTLVSLSLPWDSASIPAIDLFGQAGELTLDRYFWSPPEDTFTLVGVDAAHIIEGQQAGEGEVSHFGQMSADWQSLMAEALVVGPAHLRGVGPLLLGGFAFDALRPSTALWQGYPAGRLVLPKLLFTYLEAETWLTYNVVVTAETEAEVEAKVLNGLRERLLGHFRGNGHRSPETPLTVLQHELRSAAEWQADVAKAVQVLRKGQLEKVVLARAVELQATTPFEAARALRYLSEHYTGCYLFAFAHGDRCFLGATPERLIRLQDGEILTMSLAGSIKRGATPEEDAQLGEALLASAKNRYEHAVVVQAMVEALDEVCTALEVSPEPRLLKLGNIQHLCTTITGELAKGQTVFDVVESLNPTPAVGGRPREASLQLIRDYEKLDRGWYAGPVGWVDATGDGEFAVALRSALLRGHVATLFAGCGIMADSDPEHEYAESLLKLKPMLAALGL